MLGIFAEDDRGIPVETVEAFRDTLESLGKDHEIHVYPDVGHAFANPTGNNYDREAAAAAWHETLAFLEQHLAPAAN
ncbi:MAG: dienelactone hydrolase family protein [Woeseiaceae bacterium]|nr:dienelactone hydrolase family protein [Woeseiaceae bacterium]